MGTTSTLTMGSSNWPTVLNPRGRPINPKKRPLLYQMGQLADMIGTGRGERDETRGLLMPKFTELLNSPGYSEGEQQDILGGALSGIGGAYAGGREELANLSARTRNRAGLGSRLMELSRAEGREKAQAGFNVRKLFADEKQRRQLAGLEGLANLYGVDTNYLSNILGMQTNAAGTRAGLNQGTSGLDWFTGITSGIKNLFSPIPGT